jgi:hypothetical protein
MHASRFPNLGAPVLRRPALDNYSRQSMLTATYSVVAMMVEWQSTHGNLTALEQDIHSSISNPQQTDPGTLESTVEKLSLLDQARHSRKLERYVVPAIRKVTDEAEDLLQELESLKIHGMHLIRSVRERLRSAFEHGWARIEELCKSMHLYCRNLYQRLDREEQLLRLAQRVIPAEDWFAIAADFLADDAEHARRKQQERQGGPPSKAFGAPAL